MKLCNVYTVPVLWLQVLCYGLNLPLSELETIKDCVNVYCEWFSALTAPHVCVPRPVIDDPNPYVRDMLHHLYNLFVPRPPEAASAAVPVTTSKVPPSSQQAANIGQLSHWSVTHVTDSLSYNYDNVCKCSVLLSHNFCFVQTYMVRTGP